MRIISLLFLLFLLHSVQAQQHDLNFYITKAKAFSPLINQAQNENKVAALDLELMKSMLSKPEINVEASVLFAPIVSHDNNQYKFELVSNGATNYAGYDLAISNGGQYLSVVSLKQHLFTGSSFKTYADKALLTQQANNNRISLTTHDLERIVSHQYILCLKAKKMEALSSEMLKEFEERLLLMQKLVENAIYKESDLMLMRIEYDNYKMDVEASRAGFRSDLYDLNLICGIQDTATVDLQDIALPIIIPVNNSSAFLTAYRLDSLNIQADQSISDLKYKPQVNLFADAGLNAGYLPTLNRFGLSTGLTLSWNIFDGNQQKIQKQKTGINLMTLDYEKQNFLTQRDINKQSIRKQLDFIKQRTQLIDDQLLKYDQLLKAYQSQLAQGDISVMDFKNLEKDFASKKQEKVLLDLEKQTLIISANYWNF